MEFHFLWIIGSALFLGWLTVHIFFVDRETKPARSWYATPVVGLVMLFTWVGIQVAQILS